MPHTWQVNALPHRQLLAGVRNDAAARKSVAELLTSLEPGALSLDGEPEPQTD